MLDTALTLNVQSAFNFLFEGVKCNLCIRTQKNKSSPISCKLTLKKDIRSLRFAESQTAKEHLVRLHPERVGDLRQVEMRKK